MASRSSPAQPAAPDQNVGYLNLSEQDSSALIRSLVGERIRRPLRRYRLPAAEHVDWHYNNLFKHPAR